MTAIRRIRFNLINAQPRVLKDIITLWAILQVGPSYKLGILTF